jgi:hypothetical protein
MKGVGAWFAGQLGISSMSAIEFRLIRFGTYCRPPGRAPQRFRDPRRSRLAARRRPRSQAALARPEIPAASPGSPDHATQQILGEGGRRVPAEYVAPPCPESVLVERSQVFDLGPDFGFLRNGWPASYWNAWPASSESAHLSASARLKSLYPRVGSPCGARNAFCCACAIPLSVLFHQAPRRCIYYKALLPPVCLSLALSPRDASPPSNLSMHRATHTTCSLLFNFEHRATPLC